MSGILLAAAAASAFNLACTGTDKTISMPGIKEEAFTHELRIDFDQKKWCEGECKFVHDIQEIRPEVIVFTHKTEQTSMSFDTTDWSINRTTGEYFYFYSAKGSAAITSTRKGTCEPSSFSGFPKIETKF